LPEGTLRKIRHEVAQIDELISSFSPLLMIALSRTPDLTETTALATVLHSFYNGIENIFTIVAKEIDQHQPSGTNWHRDLIDQMAKDNKARSAIISSSGREVLVEYLSFRHFFRHSYSFHLEWEQMKSLVMNLGSNWNTIKTELDRLEAIS